MKAVTISSKYQVVIPLEIRKRFDLKTGQVIMFIRYKETLRVVMVPPIKEARDMFKDIKINAMREDLDEER
jgi:AbrB family looped-hinge helix DNA binding protein